MVECGLVEVEGGKVVGTCVVCARRRSAVVECARREVVVTLRRLIEAVGVVAALRGLQKGMI